MKRTVLLFFVLVFMSTNMSVMAQSTGPETGLQLPRFVSLKSKKVKLRVGPGRKYSVQWLYVKSGLPVEIIREFDRWRKVRDSQGTEGWVYYSLLSGRRTAIITPWDSEIDKSETDKFIKAFAASSDDSAVLARLQPGVIVKIKNCSDAWCEISAGDLVGFVKKPLLWGVYPKETIDG